MKMLVGYTLLTLLFIAGALSALPASWLGVPLSWYTPWQLGKVEGSVWSGRSQLVYAKPGGAVYLMDWLSWQWQPRALLNGRLAWQINNADQQGLVSLGWSEIEIQRFTLTTPMAALSHLSKNWNNTGLVGGDIRWQVERLSRRKGKLEGEVQAIWSGASSLLSPLQPLGAYQINMNGHNGRWQINLDTLSGPLLLQGKGVWQIGQPLILQGIASSTPKAKDALNQLLQMLGQKSGPNHVQWRIQLAPLV